MKKFFNSRSLVALLVISFNTLLIENSAYATWDRCFKGSNPDIGRAQLLGTKGVNTKDWSPGLVDANGSLKPIRERIAKNLSVYNLCDPSGKPLVLNTSMVNYTIQKGYTRYPEGVQYVNDRWDPVKKIWGSETITLNGDVGIFFFTWDYYLKDGVVVNEPRDYAIMKVSKGTSANGEACCNPGILSLPANVRTVERERVIKGAPDSVFVPVPYEVQVPGKTDTVIQKEYIYVESAPQQSGGYYGNSGSYYGSYSIGMSYGVSTMPIAYIPVGSNSYTYVDNSYYNNQVTNTTTNVVHNPPTPTPTPTPNTENGSPENPVNDPNGQTNGGNTGGGNGGWYPTPNGDVDTNPGNNNEGGGPTDPNNGGRDRRSSFNKSSLTTNSNTKGRSFSTREDLNNGVRNNPRIQNSNNLDTRPQLNEQQNGHKSQTVPNSVRPDRSNSDARPDLQSPGRPRMGNQSQGYSKRSEGYQNPRNQITRNTSRNNNFVPRQEISRTENVTYRNNVPRNNNFQNAGHSRPSTPSYRQSSQQRPMANMPRGGNYRSSRSYGHR